MPRSALCRRLPFPAVAAFVSICLIFSPPAHAGDPATSIKINEVESEGAADFIELVNVSNTATDASGLIVKDSEDARTQAVGAGTSLAPGQHLAVRTDFGLGVSDSARVFMPDGTTQIDGYDWTAHASTSYGRCPDGTGEFVTTEAVTEGAANACPAPVPPWPGSASVTPVDQAGVLGADVSGLALEGFGSAKPGVLWAVDNGNYLLHRLLWNGTQWVKDTANGWSAGKALRFPGGTGLPDAEGVTLTDDGAAGGVFVSSERNSVDNAVSRISVLRYNVSGAGAPLSATREWNLTADLPAVAPNEGAESVQWVPDTALVGAGFVDETTNAPYDPATYANHGTGLFFVGLEANGIVYAYALDQTSSAFTRVATLDSGFPTFGALHWESATNQLWIVCDNNCDGRSRVFEIGPQGRFVQVAEYARPAGMANLNNEGFAMSPAAECVAGSKPVFWADDGNAGGHVLRAGTISCSRPQAAPAAGWSGGSAPVRGDFNGDGQGDLAVGSPGENVGGHEGAGMVQVFYGSASGLTGTGATAWTQDTTGIDGAAEAGDAFGSALAVGDFNGDGRADLAIGAPGENLGAGQVHVLNGSASGIVVTADKILTQGSGGLGVSERGDHFGASLAAGRFDQSIDDLAVGAPDEDSATAADVGTVHVLLGSPGGPTATGGRAWGQASGGIFDEPEAGDRFGLSLATGNLDAGAQEELVVGAPGESSTTRAEVGRVHVLPGSASGLTATGSRTWTQDSTGVTDQAEAFDRFGSSLAVADLGGTPHGDLAIGVPGEDSVSAADVGIVQILRGADAGPTTTGMQMFGESTTGVVGYAEAGDAFGAALAAADLGGSAQAELIVGVPGETGTFASMGNVHVLPGAAAGTTATGSQVWSQNSTGIADQGEIGDRFGSTLAAGRFTATTNDVVIGVPEEDALTVRDTGVAHVLRGAGGSPGLTATGSYLLNQATGGGVAQAGDRFGGGLGR